MTWLLPLGFAALAAIPLLVVMRLRGRRPRDRTVGALLLWQQAAAERPAGAGRRSPPWADLCLEAGVLAASALALAHPAWPVAGGAPRLVLAADRSARMAARGPDGRTAWERALAAAETRLATWPAATLVTVVADPPLATGPFEGPPAAALAALRAAGPADRAGDPRPGIPGGAAAMLLTDRLPALAADDLLEVVAEGLPVPNVALAAAGAELTADGGLTVFVAVHNFADAAVPVAAALRLALLAQGEALTIPAAAPRALEIPAGAAVGVTWVLPGASDAIELRLVRPDGAPWTDALPQDDRVRLVRDPAAAPRIAWHGPEAPALRRAIRAALGEPASDAAPLLHVFHREIPTVWPDGPALCVDPDRAPPGLAWTAAPPGARVTPVGPHRDAWLAVGLVAEAPPASGQVRDPPPGATVHLESAGGAVALAWPARSGHRVVVGLPASGAWELTPAFPVCIGRLVREALGGAPAWQATRDTDPASSDLRGATTGHRPAPPMAAAEAAVASGRPALALLALALLLARLARRA